MLSSTNIHLIILETVVDFWSVVTPSVKKPRVRANPRCILLSVSASGGPYQAIARWKTDIVTAMIVTKTFKGLLILVVECVLISLYWCSSYQRRAPGCIGTEMSAAIFSFVRPLNATVIDSSSPNPAKILSSTS
jgi:hypothetical protein